MKFKKPPYIIILVIIVIAGGLILLLNSKKEKEVKSPISELSEENYKDSDNDGLRDWEEELYRTNPFNPDTDGDGYSDGQEVDLGRNPLVKAPGDELTFHPLPLGEKYNITQKILNQEALQNILLSYLSQKAEYLENHPEINDPNQFSALTDTNPSIIEEMIEISINDSWDYLMGPNQEHLSELSEIFDISISDEQIKISEDNSKQAIQFYISGISQWLNSDIFFLQNEALQIISYAIENQNFDNLDKLIKLNDEWIGQMKEITVPSSWKEIHKQGLKTIILFRNIFISLRDVENDPFKAPYAVEKLEELTNSWTELIKKAINLAQEQEIQLPF